VSFAALDFQGTRHELVSDRVATCLACGGRMADCLIRTASPRCHDCRDARAPLRADLVERRGRHLRLVPQPEPVYDLPKAA
jgi:hypothetical protein